VSLSVEKKTHRYRVWLVDHVDCGYTARFSLKKALTKTELIQHFNIEKSAKITPVLDRRMKHGGKAR